MELNNAYKISNFIYEEAKHCQRTLPNPTSLRFRKFTAFEPIPVDTFLDHHFNFLSYNQLYSRLTKSPILAESRKHFTLEELGDIEKEDTKKRKTVPTKE